jgi:cytochrome c biogenesis protein CcdA
VIDAPLPLAFAAGMIASINPCGFALLPAYIAAFVAGDDTRIRADRRITRAVSVSAAVSLGFAAMFIIVGVVFSSASSALRQQMPWLTIAIGMVMLTMGAASIAGWKPQLPFQNRATTQRRNVATWRGWRRSVSPSPWFRCHARLDRSSRCRRSR